MTRMLISAIMGMIVRILVGPTKQNRYLSRFLFVNCHCDSFIENFGKLCSRHLSLPNILTNIFLGDLLDVRSRTDLSLSLFICQMSLWFISWKFWKSLLQIFFLVKYPYEQFFCGDLLDARSRTDIWGWSIFLPRELIHLSKNTNTRNGEKFTKHF